MTQQTSQMSQTDFVQHLIIGLASNRQSDQTKISISLVTEDQDGTPRIETIPLQTDGDSVMRQSHALASLLSRTDRASLHVSVDTPSATQVRDEFDDQYHVPITCRNTLVVGGTENAMTLALSSHEFFADSDGNNPDFWVSAPALAECDTTVPAQADSNYTRTQGFTFAAALCNGQLPASVLARLGVHPTIMRDMVQGAHSPFATGGTSRLAFAD